MHNVICEIHFGVWQQCQDTVTDATVEAQMWTLKGNAAARVKSDAIYSSHAIFQTFFFFFFFLILVSVSPS